MDERREQSDPAREEERNAGVYVGVYCGREQAGSEEIKKAPSLGCFCQVKA